MQKGKLLFIMMSISCIVLAKDIHYVDRSYKINFSDKSEVVWQDLSVWAKIGRTLKREGINVKGEQKPRFEIEDCDKLLFVDYLFQAVPEKELKKVKLEQRMNIMFEPPSVFPTMYNPHNYELFHKIFTFDDRLVDGVKFIKYRYPSMRPMDKNLIPFEERKFACCFFGNKTSQYKGELYSEREKLVRFFQKNHPKDLDFYGTGWSKTLYPTYLGAPENKKEVLKQYKFSFAFENTKDVPGYITEKIFDCFEAGVVPIYLGSPTVEEEIPQNCFIDSRRFKNYEELYVYLSNITEEEYANYLESISLFLQSEEAKKFDTDHFVLSIVNGILDQYLEIEDLF
ncbi:MAG: hypothetical protein FJZ56_02285 [Chlamydiae bacterium]|nr:hypothetical protein [Chlamydiota bacterium]